MLENIINIHIINKIKAKIIHGIYTKTQTKNIKSVDNINNKYLQSKK
jgi:hypothetical protein